MAAVHSTDYAGVIAHAQGECGLKDIRQFHSMPKHFFETSSIDTEKNWHWAKSTDPPALYSWFRERAEDRIFTPGCNSSGEVNDRTPTSPAKARNSSTISTRQSEESKPFAFLYLFRFAPVQKKKKNVCVFLVPSAANGASEEQVGQPQGPESCQLKHIEPAHQPHYTTQHVLSHKAIALVFSCNRTESLRLCEPLFQNKSSFHSILGSDVR
ncbi:uncharacterized [Tachysurus ichikawai]